jgi:hypothetical protein
MFGDRLEGLLEAVKKGFGGNRRHEDFYTLRMPGLLTMPEKKMPGQLTTRPSGSNQTLRTATGRSLQHDIR